VSTLNAPSGLGGWLVIAAIGLIIMPIRNVASLYNDSLPIFSEGYWGILTTQGTEAYHPLWGPLIIFESAGNIFFLILNIILIYLFFKKSYRFPTLYAMFLMANLLFAIADYYLAGKIPALAVMDNTQASQELGKTIIFSMVWISYFLISKRVKNTFVVNKSNKPINRTEDTSAFKFE